MAATVGVKEEAEQVGGLELQDVVAWGCGLCQGRLLAAAAAAAAAVVAVAGIVAGRAGTTVVAVVAIVVVAVVAAAIAFAVAVIASDPAGPLRGKAILRWRDLRVLALVLERVLTLRRLLFVVVPRLLRLLSVWRPTYRALGVADYTDLLIGIQTRYYEELSSSGRPEEVKEVSLIISRTRRECDRERRRDKRRVSHGDCVISFRI
ncbi:hypothetical protein Taro_053286 [Colocasia esculenta]|uniref:Uncharacterized protein n=1 Tax=Colocasia esculenta TaxID=4460 RepID=A0A843XKI7_COLES|nr:hypothetical protein [Colocasia esculenta]